MKKLTVLLFMSLIAFGLNSNVKAQGEAAVPFLLLNPDSRAGGIGESGAGLADNVSAIHWNPAGIAFLEGSEFGLTHSNWLPQFNLDIFYDYLSYRQYINSISGSVLASIRFMNYGQFARTTAQGPEVIGTFNSYDAALTLGYATKLHSDWGFGVNFRIIHSRLSDQPTGEEQGKGVSTTVSFDVSGMWRPEHLNLPLIGNFGNKFSVGANLSNLGPKIYYIDQDQADPIPTNFRLGFAFRLFEDEYNSLTYTLDFSKLLVDRDTTGTKSEFYESVFTAWADQPMQDELRDIVTSMGLEYWYGKPGDFMFAFRTGYFYEDPAYGNRKFLTLGAGIRYDIYGFDFSYISAEENHPLANTLRFSLLIGWGGSAKTQHGFPRGI